MTKREQHAGRERERERERERLKKTNALVVWTGTYIMVLPSARERYLGII